jgi:transglutaminase/protease-like cytokinesis protein 3
MNKQKSVFLLLIFISLIGRAQPSFKKFEDIDQFVFQLGKLSNNNVAEITDTLTHNLESKEFKSRAIYSWICNNIALDPKSARNNDPKNSDPEVVIQIRKASPIGFAKLFQEMASQASIRCLIVDGYNKFKTDNINNKEDETNYSWNVVQLGTSPNEWYYVDAANGSGYLDVKQTIFTHSFNHEYFFSNKYVFNLDHFAKNTSWLLGEGPKSLKDFYALPLVRKGSYEFILSKALPSLGFIKAKLNTPFKFNLRFNKNKSVNEITVISGEGLKRTKPERINFEIKDDEIYFYYKFKKEDTTPFTILVDGKEILTYLVEISE